MMFCALSIAKIGNESETKEKSRERKKKVVNYCPCSKNIKVSSEKCRQSEPNECCT